ncbi:type IIL restriction-modification enzyme MmeI [Actinomyces graevenitzii]|uniref:type IIL restriction-modification enzyme MmeI n=1 Tax=Actinomyces graevenitzii TaxID=55565 RepID=UPI002ED97DE1
MERLALRPVDLDKPESRQGKMKTPLVQALDYVEELPRLEQPRFVVTCNFETFRVYDRDAWAKSQLIDHGGGWAGGRRRTPTPRTARRRAA